MLKSLRLKNFTVFGCAELDFCSGLNVFVGENSSGKTHLLKLPYVVAWISASNAQDPNASSPTKTLLQPQIGKKLVTVFRSESLGRLVRRKQGRNRCEVGVNFDNPGQSISFSFATQSKSVDIDGSPSAWLEKSPVFLPTRELLTIYPGFIPMYDAHYLEFEENIRDTCVLLGVPLLREPRESIAARMLGPLEKEMGGKIVLEQNGRFYLKVPGTGNMEMPLVAEGLRKLATLARLVSTGSLVGQGCLFWDEPEANLNPRLIRQVASSILEICSQGVQVFVATHSLFLLREFEILLSNGNSAEIPQRYFALGQSENGVQVRQGCSIDEVEPLVLLDEELQQSDRFLEGMGEKDDDS